MDPAGNRAEGDTEVEITVRSTDLGSDQYVRGEVYFTYFEQSRLEHLRRLVIVPRFPVPDEAENYFAIAETTARYCAAARFGDRLIVRTRTEAVGRSSFTLAFTVQRGDDGEVLAEGRSVQVWLDGERRPAPIPPSARVRLERTLAGPVS
jgi:YbgC/YbaW family acyl-CoA thioester hydrolase